MKAVDYEAEIGHLTYVTLWRLRAVLPERDVQRFLECARLNPKTLSEHTWKGQPAWLEHDVRSWWAANIDGGVSMVDCYDGPRHQMRDPIPAKPSPYPAEYKYQITYTPAKASPCPIFNPMPATPDPFHQMIERCYDAPPAEKQRVVEQDSKYWKSAIAPAKPPTTDDFQRLIDEVACRAPFEPTCALSQALSERYKVIAQWIKNPTQDVWELRAGVSTIKVTGYFLSTITPLNVNIAAAHLHRKLCEFQPSPIMEYVEKSAVRNRNDMAWLKLINLGE